ncbi:hypothetical protein BO71DRAFT_225600 [Aspergillus ellipticus CBS 707.79]|uniref:Uncharacterized protein n=1 Tax=Aspergillus ellipticus CBS 707.79 TaxID=1448320 RepID=A0A319EU29_9EURO|nr:hypothetical protein BO71DRAFT_225600 [Aspergillus ellipticus CBS 707.79]
MWAIVLAWRWLVVVIFNRSTAFTGELVFFFSRSSPPPPPPVAWRTLQWVPALGMECLGTYVIRLALFLLFSPLIYGVVLRTE